MARRNAMGAPWSLEAGGASPSAVDQPAATEQTGRERSQQGVAVPTSFPELRLLGRQPDAPGRRCWRATRHRPWPQGAAPAPRAGSLQTRSLAATFEAAGATELRWLLARRHFDGSPNKVTVAGAGVAVNATKS